MPKRKPADNNEKLAISGKVRKTAKGFKFPEHISPGFIIKDTKKREWQIQDTIGTGGFGEIYSACEVSPTSTSKSNVYSYAIKVEPKENGPLYVEMHFYMRVAKAEDIEEWKRGKKLKNFGMPVLHGSGSFEYKSNSYRFLVTDRLGKNLQSILTENNKQLPFVTVLKIGVQVLNVLEYIHAKGYIHGDLKAANMMLGLNPGTENTVYIIDFGLASKCASSSKEFNKDPKRANNGTIEYISRDGHAGVFGFRGDLEIFGYNLLHWLNGSLPWEKNLKNATVVEQKKTELMADVKKYIKENMPELPDELIKYLEYVASLKNNDIPDYDYCKNLFLKKLTHLKCSSPYDKLVFGSDSKSVNSSPPSTPRLKAKRKSSIRPVVVAKKAAVKNTKKHKSLKNDSLVNNEAPSEEMKIKRRKKGLNNLAVDSNEASTTEEEENSDVIRVKPSTSKLDSVGNAKSSSKKSSNKVAGAINSKNPRIASLKAKNNLQQIKKLKNCESKENILSADTNGEVESNSVMGRKKTAVNSTNKNKVVTPKSEKPSWRNAPSVIASNIKVAGEYEKNSTTYNKRK